MVIVYGQLLLFPKVLVLILVVFVSAIAYHIRFTVSHFIVDIETICVTEDS